MKRQSPPGTTFEDKLLRYTIRDPDTGCLNWTASLRYGYGQHGTKGHSSLVHIAVWEVHHGARPPGSVIRHRCHNPRCAEISHLNIGTQADNMRDMDDAGRRARGAALPHTKLTTEQVVAIRVDPRKLQMIADDYGIHYQTVYRIRAGLRRMHG